MEDVILDLRTGKIGGPSWVEVAEHIEIPSI